ncbi:hypothetical protein SAMN04489740_2233 [Arthrobacter alpinus]|uniref:DUF4352 domain-containing protein n=2 Tax=Arthrobacter alpinus TaxID=656366 RepID=A0A1H5KZD6_9MICC|nr:hypothetical protein SAMN04489740_2233 [Arthrobacter alpinus]
MQAFPPQPTKVKKQRNVVGLVALIVAVLGFIFACIPGALIIGWILLPIAFVLSLVSLFLKDKAKWMGVTALLLSIVGTIVGVAVFFSVIATSVDNAIGSGDTTVVQPSADAGVKGEVAQEKSASDAGTRENPHPIGSVIESDDWRVVINSVTLAATDAVIAANSFNEPPAVGSEYIVVNYSATYIGDDPNGQMPAFVSVEYVTADGKTVNGLDKMVIAADAMDSTSALYAGGTATGNKAIEVPTATAGQGVLAVRPGMLGDKIFVAVK